MLAWDATDQHPVVKFQKIRKDEGVVIVGRVRVPTPMVNEVGPAVESNADANQFIRYLMVMPTSSDVMTRASSPQQPCLEQLSRRSARRRKKKRLLGSSLISTSSPRGVMVLLSGST
jgi:hypothetical protein